MGQQRYTAEFKDEAVRQEKRVVNPVTLPERDAVFVIADDSSVRAVVIRGAGSEHFSVGMDLKQLPEGAKRKGSVEAPLE